MEILKWHNVVKPSEEFHISRAEKTARNSLRPHGHDFAEVFWIDAGQGTHIVNGEAVSLTVGDVIFIRPGDVHAIETDDYLHLTNLAFAHDVLGDFESRYFANTNFAWWTKTTLPTTAKIESEVLARFTRWADELSHAPREEFWLHRCLLNILHQLLPHEATFLRSSNSPPWLQHACREMEKPENLTKGLEHFFALAGRSREHTARSLRQSCGLSPTEFLQNLRLQRAARQLEMSDKEILAVAFDCGFENISHFYRLFKTQFGETPKAYRKRRRLL